MAIASVRSQPSSRSSAPTPRLQRTRAGRAQPAGSPFATLTQVAQGVQPTPAQLLQLQQTVGNGAVQRLVSRRPGVQRCGEDDSCACAGCSSERTRRKGAASDETLQRATGDGHDLSAAPIAGDPQLEDAFDGDKTKYVRQGAKGETVRKLQNALLWLGEELPTYGPDGDYGGETKRPSSISSAARKLATMVWSADTLGAMDSALGAAPGPTPLPSTPPVVAPGDFKIDHVGKHSQEKVFFERGKADLLAGAKTELDKVKTGAPATLKLVGFVSADEDPALAETRAKAVESHLTTAPSAVTVAEAKGNPGAAADSINFSRARSVDVAPAGPPPKPSCKAKHASGPDKGKPVNPAHQPCPVMDPDTWTAFNTAWPVSKDAMARGVNAADPASGDFNKDLVKQFFGDDSPATLATLKTNLGNLKKNVDGLDAKAQCGGECDTGGCDSGPIAYMSGMDGAAKMTLCVPVFKSLHENDAARNLIHETAHGTSPLGGAKGAGTKDVAYRHERMMFHLSTADRLRNSDSYALFALFARETQVKKDPKAVPAGISTPSTDKLVGFSADAAGDAEKAATSLAVAQMEKRLSWSEDHTGQMYGELVEVKAGKKTWAASWAEDHMRQTAARFPVTAPPAKPNKDDQVIVAAINDRYFHMKKAVKRDLKITRVAAGLVNWPTDGDLGADHFDVGPIFFKASPEHQISLLLQAVAMATPDVEKQFVPSYVSLAKFIHENA